MTSSHSSANDARADHPATADLDQALAAYSDLDTVHPSTRLARMVFGTAALLLFSLAIVEIARRWDDYFVLVAIGMGVIVLIVYGVIGAGAAIIGAIAASGRVGPIIALAGAGFGIWLATLTSDTVIIAMITTVLLLTVLGGALVHRPTDDEKKRWAERNALTAQRTAAQREEERAAALAPRMIGEPGIGLTTALADFGPDRVRKGIAGEQLTADEFVRRAGEFPTVQLVNGLSVPGTENADIDHALVLGEKVALIDSKYWKAAEYTWAAPNTITAGRGHDLVLKETFFPQAVDRARSALAGPDPDIKVRAWMVLHSNDRGLITADTSNAASVGLPQLVVGENWLDAVGRWLTAGVPDPTDDELLDRHFRTLQAVLALRR